MKISITTTDDFGIKTELDYESNFDYEDDFADFFKLIFRVLEKNGVEIPEEIQEELDNLE